MVARRDFLAEAIDAEGLIAVDHLVEAFRVTKPELARVAGLSRDAVSKRNRLKSRTTQARLRDMVEIINRVLPWAGSVAQAYAWYRAQPLPSFGDQTPEDLVRQGRAEAVKRYLSRIAVGGFA